jgi:hypothetical protein
MIGMSTFFQSLRREALPLAVLAILALVLQGGAGPILSAARAQDDPGLQILCLSDVATPGSPQSAPAGHEDGFCTCGPACPHGAACQVLRGPGPVGWTPQRPEAQSFAARRASAQTRPSERFGALGAIRGPPRGQIAAG